ncbi:MAG TPA: hypothetical protein VGX76_07610, partial [Pirellulales bacterium]|nr:hypothetical protein [Pirellulales bacterium]
MRVLVGWDEEGEVELLSMYLEVGDTEVTLVRDPEALVAAFSSGGFDAVLMPVTFPDGDRSFAAFEDLRRIAPE